MVLITTAEEEQHHRHLVICGLSPPGLAHTADMDSSTTSPSAMQVKEEVGEYCDEKTSQVMNGTASHDYSREDFAKSLSPVLSHNHRDVVKTEEEEDDEDSRPQLVVHLKQEEEEEEMDAPLDFSIKRRDSFCSDSTTTAREGRHTPSSSSAVASSWHRPAPFHSSSSPSFRLSPDTSQQKSQTISGQRPHPYLPHHSNSSNSGHSSSSSSNEGWGRDASRSPSPSPSSQSLASKPASGSAAHSPQSLLSEEVNAVNAQALRAALAQKGAALTPEAMSLPSLLEEVRKLQGGTTSTTLGGNKRQRPFKAYPKEVLHMPLGYLGLPGMSPFPGMEQGLGAAQGQVGLSEELVTAYKQQVEALKEQEKQLKNASKKSSSKSTPTPPPTLSTLTPSVNGRGQTSHASPPPPASSASLQYSPRSDSPSQGTPHTQTSPSPTASLTNLSQGSDPAIPSSTAAAASLVSSTSSAGGGSSSRKRPRNMPDTSKDEAYWERRRKNNDAAKRSRDARRVKEDQIALRAALLEQENLRLRVEVATLKTETARLRCLLYKS